MKSLKQAEVAKKATKKREPASDAVVKIVDSPSPNKREVTGLQMLVIQSLARGNTIPDMARRLQHQLVPHEKNRDKRLKKARQRIRTWMSTQKMRDLLWEETMIGLDMDSPQIVRGIARKAKAGRVDAARLALELNGRHAPQAEVTPAQINIQFGNIPRPRRSLGDGHEVIDVDPDEIVEVEPD
jgi:acyl-CoA hydrolase